MSDKSRTIRWNPESAFPPPEGPRTERLVLGRRSFRQGAPRRPSDGNLIRVEKPEFQELLRRGFCSLRFGATESVIDGAPTFFYLDEGGADCFDSAPHRFVTMVLNLSAIGTFKGEECRIQSPLSLRDHLHAEAETVVFPTVKEYQAAFSDPNLDFRCPRYPFALRQKDFLDMVIACDFRNGETTCGDPFCYAEYAWVRDSRCLVLFSFSGGEVLHLETFPFALPVPHP